MGYRVNNLIYAAGPDMTGTIRTGITMTEPVVPQILEHGIRKASERFPYFSVRLVRYGSEYRMEPNDRPFVISPDGRAVTLGMEESNDHLFAFAYEGCRLYADTSHFITDGNGKFPFLKTILYYYLTERYPDEVFDTRTIALSGSEVPDAEADDAPYPAEMLAEAPLDGIPRPESVFLLRDQVNGYAHMDDWTSFVLRINQKDLMAFASSLDGSPATFIASLMYQSIIQCHPENRLPLVCGMQHQFRKALGKPFSHLCHVNVVPIIYPDRLKKWGIERLNTAARGQLILGADDQNDILTVNAHIRNEKMIRDMSLSRKHDYMRKVVLDGIGTNTFEVSYTGRVPWSGLDKYITNVVPYFDLTLSGGISIEIFSVGDVFSVNIMQRNGDRQYVDCFTALLEEAGVAYVAEEPEHFQLSGFQLPE